jgi:hypothetical protein
MYDYGLVLIVVLLRLLPRPLLVLLFLHSLLLLFHGLRPAFPRRQSTSGWRDSQSRSCFSASSRPMPYEFWILPTS